jgi:predicted short-subunit dehydrogenase-like oxidoreductase (DUF2520 family)
MKIAIIGAGNVATVLGTKLKAAGHLILQIYSRTTPLQAQAIAAQLGANLINNFSQLTIEADVYLLSVSDHALPGIAQALQGINGIIVHTAGSVSIHVLNHTSDKYGVLYPLQSLRKEKTDYGSIPLLIDGNNDETLGVIKNLADSISNNVQHAIDDNRLRLHTAAVVVSNFTNHLYSLAASYCQQEGVDFSLLHPLISETAERLQQYAPAQMQTGPAIRNDAATITKHLELLTAYPHLQKLYEILTQSIQTMNNEQ